MKSKSLKLLITGLILLLAQGTKAGMVKSDREDFGALIEESSQATNEVAKEVHEVADRAPASFGEAVVVPMKKSKFEDLVPSMEEFNLMQERMEKTDGVAAH